MTDEKDDDGWETCEEDEVEDDKSDNKPDIFHWGFSDDLNASTKAKMEAKIRDLNAAILGDRKTKPEQQVSLMMQQKKYQLDAEVSSRTPFFRSDFILRIELVIKAEEGSYRVLEPVSVWRLVKCSAGLTLRQFQDRVLAPAVGWARNYHFYLFIDPTDGSQWGPKSARHADVLHMMNHGYDYLSDLDVKLAQLWHRPGQYLYYLYDLGEGFLHRISLEKIEAPETSTAAVILLEGSGACPPEDSMGLIPDGCPGYEAFAKLKPTSKQFREIQDKAMRGLNYASDFPFDPNFFDIDHHRRAIATALVASASIPSGAKIFDCYNAIMSKQLGMPTRSDRPSMYASQENPAAGLVVFLRETPFADMPRNTDFLQELIRRKQDPIAEAVCMTCGSPHNLNHCAKCKWAVYCTQTCQRKGWKEGGHKAQCSAGGLRPLPPNPKLRFKVGDVVECNIGPNWAVGRIVQCEYREEDWPASERTAAYQVAIDGARFGQDGPCLIFAPVDENHCIRRSRRQPTFPAAASP